MNLCKLFLVFSLFVFGFESHTIDRNNHQSRCNVTRNFQEKTEKADRESDRAIESACHCLIYSDFGYDVSDENRDLEKKFILKMYKLFYNCVKNISNKLFN